MPSNLSNGHTTPVEQDNNVMELNTYEAQQDSANIGAPNRAGLRGFIQAIRHAALGSFEVDNSPTARPRLPLHRDLKAYHSQLIALGKFPRLTGSFFHCCLENVCLMIAISSPDSWTKLPEEYS